MEQKTPRARAEAAMSTVDIDKELREWLADFATGLQGDPYYSVLPDEIDENDIKELKSTLKAELLAKMPRRAYPQEINRPNGEPPSVTIDRCDAYNECLDEITKTVNEL